MKILLIDDDSNMCTGISQQFNKTDVICDVLHTGQECIRYCQLYSYDLVILDIMLPDINGYELLKRMRMNGITTPVLFLTNQSDMQDKLQGFEVGADDYIVKPFVKEEFFARVHAIIRRSKGYAASMITLGLLEVNLKDKYVQIKGKRLDLTNTEYKILELFILHKGSTLHKDIFFEHIYNGTIEVPEIKIIDVFICKIRKKIADLCGFDPGYIKTVWGRGYMMDDMEDESTKIQCG